MLCNKIILVLLVCTKNLHMEIQDLTQEFNSSQYYVIVEKDGLTAVFNVDFTLNDDLKLEVENLYYQSCLVTESDVDVTPNDGWIDALKKEIEVEILKNETFIDIEAKRIIEYYSEESDRDFSRRMSADYND